MSKLRKRKDERKRFLIIYLFLIFSSCSNTELNISDEIWNEKIITEVSEIDVDLIKNEEIKNEIQYILNFRKDFVVKLNKLVSTEKASDLIIYENYNCEYIIGDKFEIEIPFSKNRFHYNFLVISRESEFYYEVNGFSQNNLSDFVKKKFNSKEEHLEFLQTTNIGVKKSQYLLNDISITTKLTKRKDSLNLNVVSFRLN